MTKRFEVLRRTEDLPPLRNAQIVLVFPFYNEEKDLIAFIGSLRSNFAKPDKLYLLGIDHGSNDNSERVLKKLTRDYTTTAIIHESRNIASVGIPRQAGIKTALELANQNSQQKLVIGSIDADSIVSPYFLEEANKFLENHQDFLIFPTRNNQNQFLECIQKQHDAAASGWAIRTLIGVDWLKYQFRALLLRNGAVETRGSGGYFFTLEGYTKAQGHRPVYSADGTIVAGESNAIGIRAKRHGATVAVSPYLNIASPRRIFKSLRSSNGGYALTASGKTFEALRNNQELPILQPQEWDHHYQTLIYGAVRTFAIKAVAYEIVPQLQNILLIPELYELIKMMFSLYEQTTFASYDEKDAIGSKTYISLFEKSYESIGANKQVSLMHQVHLLIPSNNELFRWARDTSSIIHPIAELR